MDISLQPGAPYSRYRSPEADRRWEQLRTQHPLVGAIVDDLHARNLLVYVVGGWVRDALLERPFFDCDIEVHGCTVEELTNYLSAYGPVVEVGAAFGVLRIKGLDVEWALPRRDSAGRKPVVVVDPFLTLPDALERRDLTINALAYEVTTQLIHDPWDGVEDMKALRLRTPNPLRFIEDPLRFYRVMQYISRFEMTPDPTLTQLCRTMDLSGVARERVGAELDKMFLLSRYPSRGIRWLAEIVRLSELMPEVAAVQETPQNPTYHPEGSVFEHTMQAVDVAGGLRYEHHAERLQTIWAVLCHDLGKAVSTRWHQGRLISWGHEDTGVPLARSLMKRFMEDTSRIARVAALVKFHMRPGRFVADNAGKGAYQRLAQALYAHHLTIYELSLVARADYGGRGTASNQAPIDEFLRRAEGAGVQHMPVEPLLRGQDLVGDIPAGPLLGKALAYAYEIQCDAADSTEPLTRESVRERVIRAYQEGTLEEVSAEAASTKKT